MGTIFERLTRVIAGVIAVNEGTIVAEALLIDDLGADSLDLVNLITAVEEEFSSDVKALNFPEEEAQEIRSVQHILDFLAKEGFADTPPSR
ncbi:MAG: acyl carrier protein [Syntrophales bacterium]|nr:acyl carrier protein [Syntrophales bacterium]